MGSRQQSLSPGPGEGKRQFGRHRRDLAKPGVVLRRPVGSDGSFSEHAKLPMDLGGRPAEAARKSVRSQPKKPPSRPVDKEAQRKTAIAYEREQRSRELERSREGAARQKERERRKQAVETAQAALDKVEREHANRAAAIQAEVAALEKRP